MHADVVVIGAGHAGIEAAAAAARMGARVLVVSQRLDSVGRMSCNPSIGGLAKGQLVREVDAMGGLMGTIADATGIQFRMLNGSKGPAVQAPRAQCDREAYAAEARRQLEAVPGVELLEGEVDELLLTPATTSNRREPRRAGGVSPRSLENTGIAESQQPTSLQTPAAYTPGSPEFTLNGVRLTDGRELHCGAVVLCAGTFMRGLLHCGEQKTPGGRHGAPPAQGISALLLSLGFDLRRLKTGTSARMDLSTIDLSAMESQPGDDPPLPFSFTADPATFRPRQINCWLTRTTEATHELIRANIHRSPMYAGEIEGTGPRYCPSIEDKVVRFAGRDSHQVFVEPEGFDTPVTYLAGISTSLPAEVQDEMMRTLPGLENARILRHGYAVEYDFLPACQVDRGLMTHRIAGFFLAGQILGTSGYEEAAGQGLMAGLNAARWAARDTSACASSEWVPFALGREQAYIGVMIDDLITKVPVEPYRMFTSRAEHRLLLRSDNADRRLTRLAADLAPGLVSSSRIDNVEKLEAEVAAAFQVLRSTRRQGVSLHDELRRPEVKLAALIEREPVLQALQLTARAAEQVEIDAKYEGYLKIQAAEVARQARLEGQRIPRNFDFATLRNLSTEARQKLSDVRPDSIGQARRIAGVNPSDIAVLLLALSAR